MRPQRFVSLATTVITVAAVLVGTAEPPAPAATGAPSAVPPTTTGVRPAVGQELPGLRTATSRTYVTADGSYRAVLYPAPVNYRDAHGAWQPIDDTLTTGATADGAGVPAGYAWQTRAAAPTLALPAALTGAPLRLQQGGTVLTLALLDATAATGTAHGAAVTYANALPGVDVTDAATSTGLKETLTLTGPAAATTFGYRLTVPAGATVTGDGSGLRVLDAGGATLAVMPPGYLRDAAGATSSAVGLTAAPAGDGSWRLTMTADSGWLRATGRAWPVLLDPSVVFAGPHTDCYVTSGADQNVNKCSYASLDVGYDGSSEVHRTLINFTGLPGAIPADAQVTLADLQLYLASESTSTQLAVAAYPITRSWTNAATWNTYDGTHSWTSPGGDYDAANTIWTNTAVGGSTGVWEHWYATWQTQDWLNGSATNNGFELKATNESLVNEVLFDSWDNTDTAHWPQLTVTYQLNRGEQPFYSYTSHRLTDRATLKVNNGDGILTVHNDDLAVHGAGIDLHVTRDYNSGYGANGLVGSRWTLSIGDDTHVTPQQDNVKYTDPSNSLFLFKPNGSGGYTSPPGLDADLAAPDSTHYTITYHKSGEKLTFTQASDGSGEYRLSADADRNGNQISVRPPVFRSNPSESVRVIERVGGVDRGCG